jgi:hypothetical protein
VVLAVLSMAASTGQHGKQTTSPPASKSRQGTCDLTGENRWSVKVGTDSAANDGNIQWNLNNPIPTTIADLRSMYVLTPTLPADDTIRLNTEFTVYAVYGYTTSSTRTRNPDGDYDLEISENQNGNGKTLWTEIPDPDCIGASSPFKIGIAQARAAFENEKAQKSDYVRIVGVSFWDINAASANRPLAKHEDSRPFELHPVIGLCVPQVSGSCDSK